MSLINVLFKKKNVFQIQDEKGDVTITNDGATILKQMQVLHPAAIMVRSDGGVDSSASKTFAPLFMADFQT